MKKIFVLAAFAILVTVAFLTSLVFLVIGFCKNDSQLMSLTGALVGVWATIAFGIWIPCYFQYMNDRIKLNKDMELKEKIRNREFSKIRILTSNFVGIIEWREKQLMLFPGVKGSFSKFDIDIDNLTLNYFIFNELYEHIDSYSFEMREKDVIKENIDVLFMRDNLGIGISNGAPIDSSESYEAFLDFLYECKRLVGAMEQINIDHGFDVFSTDEINVIEKIVKVNRRPQSLQSNVHYGIMNIFKNILEVEKFIKADFLKENYINDLWKNLLKEKNEQNAKIKEWKDFYTKKAKSILEDIEM